MSTYDKIKQEGLELFSRYGYDKTSMDDIAKKVGIKKASMYSHLKSKDELYLSIFTEVVKWDSESLDQLYRLIALAGVRAKLKAVFDYYFHLYKNEDVHSKILFLNRTLIFPPEGLRKEIEEINTERGNWEKRIISDIFFEGMNSHRLRPMDARDFQGFFFCMIDGLFAASTKLGREEYFQRGDGIWNQFWESVKAE